MFFLKSWLCFRSAINTNMRGEYYTSAFIVKAAFHAKISFNKFLLMDKGERIRSTKKLYIQNTKRNVTKRIDTTTIFFSFFVREMIERYSIEAWKYMKNSWHGGIFINPLNYLRKLKNKYFHTRNRTLMFLEKKMYIINFLISLKDD